MMAPADSCYFLLSYARVPPMAGAAPPGRDPLVTTFFGDLTRAVAERASGGDARIGLYDGSAPPGTDGPETLRRALEQAEVLVVLASPRYRHSTSATRELDAFTRRVAAAGATLGEHVEQVLWLPFPAGTPVPRGLQDRDVPKYHEVGLAVLCHAGRLSGPDALPEYRDAYREIVRRIAGRIVDAAERAPMGPSPISGSLTEDPVDPRAADLLIAIDAPSGSAPVPGSDRTAYGAEPADWAPYARSRSYPIAGQAIAVTTRLDLTAAVTSVAGAARLWRGKPTVLLVDVWLLADQVRAGELAGILDGLPSWVVPLMIVDRDDRAGATRVADLRRSALALLGRGADPETSVADTAERFHDLMPALVTRARSNYLHTMPRTYPDRRRLGPPGD
ncbi:FxsC protein [Actinoplanes sp. NPDC051851]|uniref:FxsC protein n=1 Tax=Actinoplanes sp. NPDC051851 TaxID=3154753 RepID=UPI0034351C38